MKKFISYILALFLITSVFLPERSYSVPEISCSGDNLAPLLRSPNDIPFSVEGPCLPINDPQFVAVGRSIFELLINKRINPEILEKKLRDDLSVMEISILSGIDFSTISIEADHVFFTYTVPGISPFMVEIFFSNDPLPSSENTVQIDGVVINLVIEGKVGYAINLTGGALSAWEHEQINRAVHFSVISNTARTLFKERPPLLPEDRHLRKDTSDTELLRDLRSLRTEKRNSYILVEYDASYLESEGMEPSERFMVLSIDEYLERSEKFRPLEDKKAIRTYGLLERFPHLNPVDRKEAYKAIVTSRNYGALRAINRTLSEEFEVVIADIGAVYKDGNIIFHPGNSRNTTYISRDHIKALSELYAGSPPQIRSDIIQIMWEAFFHEDEHSIQHREMSGSDMNISEADINNAASSFRVRTFFRVLHAYMKTGEKPDLDAFFNRMAFTERKNISYIYAYKHLSLEQHLDMAEKLSSTRPAPDCIDGILAQKHLGAVFYNSVPGSPEFERARKILSERRLINKGQETGEVFAVYKFIRELVRQYSYIIMEETLEESVVKARSLDQFEPWEKGTEEKAGDSVYLPKKGETTAIAVTKDVVARRIRSISGINDAYKERLISDIKEAADGKGTVLPRSVLETVGTALIKRTTVGVSAAGKGTRYAEVNYDNSGKSVNDKAKGVYKIPLPEDGERSIVEILIAQIRNINSSSGTDISLDLYTSHFTQDDIEEELLRLGYTQEVRYQDYLRGTFTHPDMRSPTINIYRIRKSLILGGKTGDFYMNIVGAQKAINMDLQWPDAHDSTFLDFFVSGSAYRDLKAGNKYRFISNIDNRAGVPDPVLLALMELTDSALLNEAPPMKGEPGGSLSKFKETSLPSSFDFGTRKGILEGFEFSPDIFAGMDPAERDAAIKKYFPLFNSANYTIDIIKFAREAFYPGYSDQAIIDELEKFHEAQRTMDSERLAELKFALEEKYRRKLQTFERDKTLPFGILVSHLAGSIPWIIKDTLFVEVPASDEGGENTRFEPLKENIYNLKKLYNFVETRLIRLFGEGISLEEIELTSDKFSPRDSFILADIRSKYKGNPTLADVKRDILKSVNKYERVFARLQSKHDALYADPPPTVKGSVKNALHDIFFKNGGNGTPLRVDNNITVKELMNIREGKFSETTIRTEVNMLAGLGILEKGPLSTGGSYTWKLTERFRALDADVIRKILEIPELNRFEIKKRTDIIRSKIEAVILVNSDNYAEYLTGVKKHGVLEIIGSDTYRSADEKVHDIQTQLEMVLIHSINKSLFDKLFPLHSIDGRTDSTLWHVISGDLIPSGMRASFIETIRDLNSIPGRIPPRTVQLDSLESLCYN